MVDQAQRRIAGTNRLVALRREVGKARHTVAVDLTAASKQCLFQIRTREVETRDALEQRVPSLVQ